jgi:superfamily I DNA/RNA helicase
VLTSRVAHLVQRGIDASSILAVTFSNRAAEEMRKRLDDFFKDGEPAQRLQISTFHAFGLGIIREHLESTGRTEGFIIFNDGDRREIIAQLVDADQRGRDALYAAISREKRSRRAQIDENNPRLMQALQRYEEELIRYNAFDLDDLIIIPTSLLRDSEGVLRTYREQYRYVLIDEYQDVNQSQYELIRLLMPGDDANLFAIGDPDQAIYGFRGADVRFIKRFIKDYPDASVYTLKRSYRCSSNILEASQGILGRADGKSGFLEGLSSSVKVKIVEQASERSEAEFVARTIERMMGGLRFFSMDSDISEGGGEEDIQSLSDFAVLCRIKEQMKPLIEAFENHSIPHQVIGTLPFYREHPVSAIIDLMKLSMMPGNSLLRNRLFRKKVLKGNDSLPEISDYQSVRKAAEKIVELYFNEEKRENETPFQIFLDLCGEFDGDTQAFFQYIDLGSGTDAYRSGLEQVALLTIHAAKGLEFPCVFITGCEDGLIPYEVFENRKTDADEERRLLYVGMTRAQKYLVLSHARKRFLFGKTYNLRRSRFLDSIEEELLEFSQADYTRKGKKPDNQFELF